MATKLSKPVIRVVSVKDANGREGEVFVTLSGSGVSFHKGRRKLPPVPWAAIAKAAALPSSAPAKFTGDPLGWLVELSHMSED